jgi:hypothetical protein
MNVSIVTALVRLKRLFYALLTLPVAMSVVLVATILILALWIIDGKD